MRALACLVLALISSTAAAEPARIVAAHVVSRVGDTGVADDRPRRARRDQGVTLFAVVEVARGASRTLYSDAGPVLLRGRRVATHPLTEAPPLRLAWNRVEPTAANLSNTASGAFRFESIAYQATAIAGADGGHLAADVRPTLTPDHGSGVGTMRFQVVVTPAGGGAAVRSPGIDARAGRGTGGLADAVHRVSLRRDDTYLGYLTELYGQPYIWASAGLSDRTHQSERLEGADCADFVVYGARRLGKHLPYMWTGALPAHARTISRGAYTAGVYLDPAGRPLPFPRIGDLILFPRHVGVLVADRGRPGVLDADDVMMHALFDSPKEQRIAESGYAENPISVLRWR